MSEPQPPPQQQSKLFRQEALDYHARPEARGTPLRVMPAWMDAAWWVVVALVLVAGVGLALVDINDHARGPVLVCIKGLEEVTATAGGRVSRVLVRRGERVRAGQAPTSGTIRYDGVPRTELELKELRQQVGVELQAPSLSGGQRQRMALARALVNPPAILLLEEATNALDARTERAVQDAIAELKCTRVVIAHRLSTVKSADLLLVMKGGRLVARGTHAELMAKGGDYFELVAAQERGPARGAAG
jgi:biotin carboxyl carrier protein